ncbi:MAG: efflux RND transporter permease subunit [Pseudomonadota bacterium]
MNGLIDWALGRTRMMLALITLAVVFGVSAYVSLPRQGAPEVDIPALYVSVPLDGASASDVERLLLKPLEQEIRDIKTLKTLDTFASEGYGVALLEFEQGWDKPARLADLRDRVDRARTEMPAEADEPNIAEISLQEVPVVIVAVSGSAPERARLQATRALQRELESLPGVLEAELTGARDEVLEAVLDPTKMEALGVSAGQLVNLVQANNRLVAAGALRQGTTSASVTVPGSFETAEDAAEIPVVVDGDRVVRLGEIADIRRTFEDAEGAARFNGQPAMALQVKKRPEANIIDTVAAVRAAALALEQSWPQTLQDTIELGFVQDQSVEVEDMVGQLEASVTTAVMLVMLVVFIALGVRSALLVGFAVPASFVFAFALFAVLGFSVDNMVMFGLILAVGMLVDGAIVVAELADRYMREGAAPNEAYAKAARRMVWPITSSTATTLAAFLPMLFWPGMPGEFMRLLPITLIFVLTASLITALIFLPVIGAVSGEAIARVGNLFRRGRGRGAAPEESAPQQPTQGPFATWFGGFIRRLIGRPIAIVMALGLAAGGVFTIFSVYGSNNNGTEFFVATEPVRAILHVRALGNFSPAEMDRLVRKAEERVLAVDGVGGVFAFSGGGGLEVFGTETPQDSIGQLQIELEPWQERFSRDRRGLEVMEEIRAVTAELPGVTPELKIIEDSPQQGKPVQVQVTSADQRRLEAVSDQVEALLRSTPGLIAIDDTRPLPGLQWRLDVDRAAAGRFGADMSTIGALVQLSTRGVVLDDTTPDDSDEAIDVLARFRADTRTLEGMDALRIATNEGVSPLSNFVTRTAEPAQGAISRRDGVRFYLIRADVAAGYNDNAMIAALQEKVAELKAAEPANWAGAKVSFVGDQEEQAETAAFLGGAMFAALGLIFLILLAQFNSVYNSVLVLSAVAMSVGGVLIGILLMGQTFSIIMTGTGIVALAGIVVNNNIVLIDTYQEYAKRMGRLEAISRTAEHRLRPVVLTSVTTMAGLTPMMFATSIDFAALAISIGSPSAMWWIQLATAVVFGLGFATLLTLIVTPSALAARVWVEIALARMMARAQGLEPEADAVAKAWAGPADDAWDAEAWREEPAPQPAAAHGGRPPLAAE